MLADEPAVSAGVRNDFGDGLGTLSAHAVLFQIPANNIPGVSWLYKATRVDMLLYSKPGGAPRSSLTDFAISLYAE